MSTVIHDRIRRGDILVAETAWNTSPFSWTIRWVQKRLGYPLPERKAFHWAVVITDDGDVLEAEPFRIRKGHISRYKNYLVFRHRDIWSEQKRNEMVECARIRKDNLINVEISRPESSLKSFFKRIIRRYLPYDEKLIAQLLLYSFGLIVKWNSPKEDICTEFVIEVHTLAGFYLPKNYYPASIYDAWRGGWVDRIEPIKITK